MELVMVNYFQLKENSKSIKIFLKMASYRYLPRYRKTFLRNITFSVVPSTIIDHSKLKCRMHNAVMFCVAMLSGVAPLGPV
jgi:hypothetical protein